MCRLCRRGCLALPAVGYPYRGTREPHGYAYEGGSSRLARFSGLCMNSTDVHVRASLQGRIILLKK